MEATSSPAGQPPEMLWLDRMAGFLDNRFRIPGTQIHFGADFLIGLIPYAGDVITFLISGFLVIVMARNGAGSWIVARMIGNIWFDGLVGTVPLLGDIFDLGYRANLRNVRLMKAYYVEGRHRGSVWPLVLLIVLILLALVGLSIYIVWRVMYWVVT